MKQEANPEWIERVFGSVQAWRKSRPRTKVRFGRRRREVIHIKLISDRGQHWILPCPDRPPAPQVLEAVSRCVTGFGPRPRLEYTVNGQTRIAIGRKGEHVDILRAELVSVYGLLPTRRVGRANDAVAEYVATGGNYRPFARALRVKDGTFLRKAADPAEVERAVILSDRQLDRVWGLLPTYQDGTATAEGTPTEGEDWGMREVYIGDPGGERERPAPLPMAIPKIDGRGRHNLYFGHALEYGGGRRWSEEDFAPPLRIALGGLLNRQLGFGNSTFANQVLAYAGDGFHWGRRKPMANRTPLGRDVGPVCRTLTHPEPGGEWYSWLGRPYPVPDTTSWEAWGRRRSVYDRERKKTRLGSKAAAG